METLVYMLLLTVTLIFAMAFLMFLNQLDMQKKIENLERELTREKENTDYIIRS